MKSRDRAFVHITIAAVLGAGYGLWGLEAASPFAVPLVLWGVLVLLLAWRMHPGLGLFSACTGAFVLGFGLVWTIVLGRLLATCKPPSCQTTDAATDVFYAAALLVPLIVVGSILLGVRKLVSRDR